MNRVKLTNPLTFFGVRPPVPLNDMTTQEFAKWIKIIRFWDTVIVSFCGGALGSLIVITLMK